MDENVITEQAGAGVFSPDNSKMAFAITEADPDQEEKDDTLIYIVDLKTQKMEEFNHSNGAVKLSWDGDQLLINE